MEALCPDPTKPLCVDCRACLPDPSSTHWIVAAVSDASSVNHQCDVLGAAHDAEVHLPSLAILPA